MRELAESGVPAPSEENDVPEVELVADDTTWTVRVLGRSGGGSGARPSLLLVGFWRAGDTSGSHALEATVVARTLAELSIASLETALSVARAPPDPDRKRSFFDEASQARRR